jgi:pimeloyl-ACP methyl ester carboxylesterase
MKKVLYYLSFATLLCGIAGVIGHSISFGAQNSTITNTYVAAWFAAIFAMSGLNLLHLLMVSPISPITFWFELVVIIWLCCSSFISLVCLGYCQDWASFSWILVTFIPTTTSASYLLKYKKWSSIEAESQEPRSVKTKIITASKFLLKVLLIFVVSLLASGSISAAIASSYPAPGRPISVLFDGANRNGNIQLYCIGAFNVTKPTIFIFSSSAHGIVDFYGLQYYLSSTYETNRRVCVHDPLGFGWSQDPFDGQFTNYEYLYRLMLSSDEPMPWHIVGWGGGGSALMYLATKYTSSIKSVTFIETYPPGIEFNYYGYQKSLSQQAISDYRTSELSSRVGLAKLILSLAIPWGLMSLFVPISPRHESYFPPERWSEFRVQMWRSKVWISQYQGIQHLQGTSDSQDPLISFSPLPPKVPVFGVYCNVTSPCIDGRDCTERINRNIYYNNKKFTMIKEINPNATIAENLENNCDLSLPVQKPLFTATSILKLYSTIDA